MQHDNQQLVQQLRMNFQNNRDYQQQENMQRIGDIARLAQKHDGLEISLTFMQDRISQLEIDLGEQKQVNDHQGDTIEQMDAKIEGLTRLLKEQAAKHTETEKIFKARDDEHDRALDASNKKFEQLEKNVQNLLQ